MWATDPFRRQRSLVAAAGLLAGLGGGPAHAGPVPTDTDLARARRAVPTLTDEDIERARRANRGPGENLPERLPVPGPPRIDALPQPRTQGPLDLEALARGYASQHPGADMGPGAPARPTLMIFVSLSMPQTTLQQLVAQAARAKASIVIRGLVNGSLRDTVRQVQGLIGPHRVAVQIDPQAFDRFAITRVPSFVLMGDGARPAACAGTSCAPADSFVRLAGDVSLDYALAHIQHTAPRLTQAAGGFRQRLKD